MTTLTKKDEAESVGPSGAPAAHSSDVTVVLRRARERIARGWAQGTEALHRDTPCASIAIERITPWDTPAYDARREAFRLFRHVIGDNDVVTWNDAPDRTQEEVLAAFDRAIALSEGNAAESRPQRIPHGK